MTKINMTEISSYVVTMKYRGHKFSGVRVREKGATTFIPLVYIPKKAETSENNAKISGLFSDANESDI